ncbi:hypothetical protein ACXO1G_02015, partial [Lactobacillus delbrueckii subsp. bulgaricus]
DFFYPLEKQKAFLPFFQVKTGVRGIFCLKTEHKSLFSNKRMPDFVRIELVNAFFRRKLCLIRTTSSFLRLTQTNRWQKRSLSGWG